MTENRNFLVLKSLVHTYIRTMKGGKQIVVKEHLDLRTKKADGQVMPSVVCPHPTCTYHEFVTLHEWS